MYFPNKSRAALFPSRAPARYIYAKPEGFCLIHIKDQKMGGAHLLVVNIEHIVCFSRVIINSIVGSVATGDTINNCEANTNYV